MIRIFSLQLHNSAKIHRYILTFEVHLSSLLHTIDHSIDNILHGILINQQVHKSNYSHHFFVLGPILMC